MHCLANFCYVCLEKKDKLLSDINSSLSVNKDIMHILGYLPFNLAWLKSLQIILICEECCLRLRQNYQFMEKCKKNSARLQSYMNKLITTSISDTGNAAELVVPLDVRQQDYYLFFHYLEEKCEIQSQDEEICKFEWRPNIKAIGDVFVDFEDSLIKEGIIRKEEIVDQSDNNSNEITEETENVFVNTEDDFVTEENTSKQGDIDDGEKYPADNNSTENMENESDSEIARSDTAHLTNADGVSSGFTCKQAHATNTNDINTATSASNIHTRMHTDENSYECAICNVRMKRKAHLVIHMRRHTGDKPYICATCKKCFAIKSTLVRHMRVHTREKPYEVHTGKK